jgi:sodium/hydrogen antiporter
MGRLLAFLVFFLPDKRNFVVIRDGFVAVSATLLVYGITELVQGYGFIAVFVTAITLRNYELNHKFHRKLHEFTDQIERIILAIVLILFGGSLVTGILNHLDWYMVLFSLAFVLLIRPLTGWLGMIGTPLHPKEKTAIAFFGIRGMGSFYYLAFALQQASFNNGPQLWSIVSFIVLLSVLIHGVTATSVIKKLEHQFAKVDPSVPDPLKDKPINDEK